MTEVDITLQTNQIFPTMCNNLCSRKVSTLLTVFPRLSQEGPGDVNQSGHTRKEVKQSEMRREPRTFKIKLETMN